MTAFFAGFLLGSYVFASVCWNFGGFCLFMLSGAEILVGYYSKKKKKKKYWWFVFDFGCSLLLFFFLAFLLLNV